MVENDQREGLTAILRVTVPDQKRAVLREHRAERHSHEIFTFEQNWREMAPDVKIKKPQKSLTQNEKLLFKSPNV